MSHTIGTSVPRRDGPAKLTGAARYTADLDVPGLWYGATVRADEAHARLLGIERDPAVDWSQVVVVTAADIPGENVAEVIVDDQPALVADEIRYDGEPIALVAAPTPLLARAAVLGLRIRTAPLAPMLDPVTSPASHARFEIVKGDVERGSVLADHVFEAEYRTGRQEHAYLETQAMLAVPDDAGGITVTGSMQNPWYIHSAVARVLALPTSAVRVVQASTGGGFGGKEDVPSLVAIHAALLAHAAGRPVRLVYDRHEDIRGTSKRHPAVIRHRTAVSRDGDLLAQDIEVLLDGGAYSTLSPSVLSRAAVHATGPYRCPNVRIRARVASTNTVPSGAFRGFGAPETEFAAEVQLDRIAEALAIPASELRARHVYREGDETATGQRLRNSVGIGAVLARAIAVSGFEGERGRTARARREREGWLREHAGMARSHETRSHEAPSRIASGVGLALGWHGTGFTGGGERMLASRVALETAADGRVRVFTAQTELGQGAGMVMPQIAAEVLGVDVDVVDAQPADTSLVPDSGPTVASRSTTVVGGLVADAAGRLRAQVEARTGEPFAVSFQRDAALNGPTRIETRFGGYPADDWDESSHRGAAYPAYSWAAAVAWVDVDLDTGQVAVRRVLAVDEIGRVVNPLLARSQVEGGTLQAVGYATIEEMTASEGRLRNDRLATYLIPTALDAPEVDVELLEVPFLDVPHGAKGLGELPMDVPAPAIVDAIHDATGAWILELPATPERVLTAIAEREVALLRERAEVTVP